MEFDTTALREELLDRLHEAAPDVTRDYPPHRYIEVLDTNEKWGGYQYVPDENRRCCDDIERRFGQPVLEEYMRLVLVTLIEEIDERLATKRLSSSVSALLRDYVGKIIARMSRDGGRAAGFYLPDNDVFCKQLSVCRLRMVPVGPELIDPLSAVPRSLFLRGGPLQIARAAWFFTIRTRGIKPFYCFHTDRSLAADFNPDGYDQAYLRVAEMLEINPEMKGLIGKSWFYDPVLERISPELAYLRTRPQQNGALLLDDVPDGAAVKAALKFSKTRQEAYDRGEYSPTYHWLMWARDDLLEWARTFRTKG